MKKILVPTDFSPNADRAIDYAVRLAKAGNATILVIHACDHLNNMGLEAGLPINEFNKKVTDDAFANLEIIQKSIEETEGVKVEVELFSGNVVDTVIVAARDTGADLVIMGTMGITSVRDSLFGTNTAAIISNSTVPVMAIPLEYDWSTPSIFLLTINNFDEVTDVLHPVFDLAAILKTEVRIMVFTDEEEASADEFLADEREIHLAEEKLQRQYPGISLKAEHLSGRHFEETITAYIEKNKIDLLAMTTHKRSFISSIFNRSITRKMSYHSKVPVLAIPVV